MARGEDEKNDGGALNGLSADSGSLCAAIDREQEGRDVLKKRVPRGRR